METSYRQQFDLTGRVAIITGASKGIGAAMARGLAEFGAQVVVSSRNQEAVDAVAAAIRATGGDAIGVACHVGDEDQLAALVQATLDQYGRIDILINNAAINPVYGPLAEATPEVFDKIMQVNVRACMILGNLCYPHLSQHGGSIINISSVEGLKPGFGLGVYSISKAALIMLTQNQAKEWGKDGIRANVICPGLIQTKFSAALWSNEKLLEQFVQGIPAGRMAQPEEMVGLALFLAGDAAAYCTGGVYTADGGFMIS
jgi:NAD(P)-dependent dehydrogenase (short-subunit alcohol dehydrogenase family)